jgi:hypothetical protein
LSLIAIVLGANMNRRVVLPLLGFIALMSCRTQFVFADDPKTTSAQMADQAFALLHQLSKGNGSSSLLYASVATFAGDAATLQSSLTHGDGSSSDAALLSLQTDRDAIKAQLRQHPDAEVAAQWNMIERRLDALASQIGNRTGNHEPKSSAVGTSKPRDSGRALSASPPGSITTSATHPETVAPSTPVTDRPEIVIASRERVGETVRVRGYLEGSALKSACIYDESRCVRSFKVNDVVGRQKVQFDLSVVHPSPTTILRVVDADERIAEAPLADSAGLPPSSTTAPENTPGTEPLDTAPVASAPSHDSATAEIPSRGPIRPSPSKRHTLGSNLGDVEINVSQVIQTVNLPRTYRITGQIVGRGITRAGIYLNGRLVQPIPIISSAKVTNFDEHVVASDGTPTIRAYTVGNQFTERSIDVSDAEDAAEIADESDTELVANSPSARSGIAVQITAIRPIASNLYVVSGIISGNEIASAGLYQNGVLAQPISLTGGIAGALTTLTPDSSRSINFNARLNPLAGPASVRAFSANGTYSEQPIIIADVTPYRSPSYIPGNPYGASPYGTNPFRNPLRSSRPLW